MKIKTTIVSVMCFTLLSTNMIFADNTSNINLMNDLQIDSVNQNANAGNSVSLIDKDMLDENGNLKIPEIEVPDDLPDFNVSLRDKYDSALNELKIQGFEVNNIKTQTPHNYQSDIENYFFTQFADTKLTSVEEIDTLVNLVSSEFNKVYENSLTELPSKEATLVWDMESVLSGASQPKGYLEALKETSKDIGKGNTSLKNEVANKINGTHNKIDPNASATKPNAPASGQASKPTSSPSSTKPNMPNVPTGTTKPTTPTLNKPSAEKVEVTDLLHSAGSLVIGEQNATSIGDKISNGWENFKDKVSSGWDKLTGKK